MLGSVVLDVAIGMAFVYLLLSLIASVVQELLSTFMQLRAANLERALRSLFSGDSIGEGMDLVERIYDHGLVRGLYRDPTRDLKQARTEADLVAAKGDKARAKQDLAEARTALAAKEVSSGEREQLKENFAAKRKILDEAERAYKAARRGGQIGKRILDPLRLLLRKLIGISPQQEINSVSNQLLLPAYIPSATFGRALIDILNPNKIDGPEAIETITRKLRQLNRDVPDNKACEALLALALRAEGKMEAFQQDIEGWYNSAMDRASGWYKKYTQGILLAIGLVLAITFNVDTIRVARALWTDKDVRQSMVDAASQYMKDHPSVSGADAGTQAGARSFNETDFRTRLENTAQQFDSVSNENLLPVGWRPGLWAVRRSNLTHHFTQSIWNGFGWLGDVEKWQVFLGWLLTAAAISFGAPFWFDTLNKFMVVRGTVKPTEKSAPEGSKDRTPSASQAVAGAATTGTQPG